MLHQPFCPFIQGHSGVILSDSVSCLNVSVACGVVVSKKIILTYITCYKELNDDSFSAN